MLFAPDPLKSQTSSQLACNTSTFSIFNKDNRENTNETLTAGIVWDESQTTISSPTRTSWWKFASHHLTLPGLILHSRLPSSCPSHLTFLTISSHWVTSISRWLKSSLSPSSSTFLPNSLACFYQHRLFLHHFEQTFSLNADPFTFNNSYYLI